MESITNHSTLNMQFINSPKHKMHICLEQTDIGELILGSDVPRYEIIWQKHGETNPRSSTMDILNIVAPDPDVPMSIPQNVYDAVMEIYGDKLKVIFNNYCEENGYKNDN